MDFEIIKTASMKEVNDRLTAIADEIDQAENLDELEKEIKALQDRKAEIQKAAEMKKSLYAQVAANPGVVEKMGDAMDDDEADDETSKAYRSAWL